MSTMRPSTVTLGALGSTAWSGPWISTFPPVSSSTSTADRNPVIGSGTSLDRVTFTSCPTARSAQLAAAPPCSSSSSPSSSPFRSSPWSSPSSSCPNLAAETSIVRPSTPIVGGTAAQLTASSGACTSIWRSSVSSSARTRCAGQTATANKRAPSQDPRAVRLIEASLPRSLCVSTPAGGRDQCHDRRDPSLLLRLPLALLLRAELLLLLEHLGRGVVEVLALEHRADLDLRIADVRVR